MADPSLVIMQETYGYGICWFYHEEQEDGAWLGDMGKLPAIAPVDRDEWENWIAENEAREDVKTDAAYWQQGRIMWDTRTAAAKCLKRIKARLKQGGRPLDTWEKIALDAGWKPPKGWN